MKCVEYWLANYFHFEYDEDSRIQLRRDRAAKDVTFHYERIQH